jgi:signal transduction histidine kinase
MIRRWPVRIRLTAAFTVIMAVILTAVAAATAAHTRAALDASITESLQDRLRDLEPAATAVAAHRATVLPGGNRDAAAQILDPGGTVLASSAEVARRPLLSGPELAAARRGRALLEHPGAGQLTGPVRLAAAPTPDGTQILVAALSVADRDAAVADLRRELQVSLPVVLLAAAVGAYLLAAGTLRPVERMRARAAAITAENLDQRLPVPASRDEISRLGETFNDLLARLHTALRQEQQFVADASHELRTPLSLLTTELELALRRPRSQPELIAALRSALAETDRLSRLAQDLLLLARTDTSLPHPAPAPAGAGTRVRPALATAVARYRTTHPGTDLTVHCPHDVWVRADSDDLDRAVTNLIDNALRHGAPPITVRATTVRPRRGRAAVVIQVRDHGTGFDPGFLPRAFDRFTRTDHARTGHGTGLGLAITAALARSHHGNVEAANHPDGGAVLTLTLPPSR